jgi:hypothetical protein
MTETNEPPTTAELFIRANTPGRDLGVKERRGDVDRIIAAGLTAGLGMMLFRLVNEYHSLDKTIKVSSPSNTRTTHRALVLIHMDMGSLYDTKHAVADFAIKLAAKRGWVLAETVVRKIVGRCIETFLDDICDACNGAKVTGLYGGPQPPCKACKGTGNRHSAIGEDAMERAFAFRLLREMEQMTWDAEADSRKNLRAVDAAKRLIITEQQKA